MPKKIQMETEVEDFNGISMEPKSNFYIINALGQTVWLKCRSRKKAQDFVDQEYGKDFFKVRTLKV